MLLSITATWCQACHEMDRTTYADPRGRRARSAIGFVAVRVDTDRRPDINERYNLGGWPTTAFLTAARRPARRRHVRDRRSDARDSASRARGASARAAAKSSARRRAPRSAAAESAAKADAPSLDRTSSSSCSPRFDDEHGGFGVDAEVPA